MAKLLVSLHSKVSDAAGLGIVDTQKGLEYLQIEEKTPGLFQCQLRGVAVDGNRVYAVTTASLRIYSIEESAPAIFRLEREIILPEWYAGGDAQADLLPLHLSRSRSRIFIGCNAFSTIDEFSLEGRLLNRRHLAEVAPNLFEYSEKSHKKNAYGRIRSICESSSGEVLVTVSHWNGSECGWIFELDSGDVVVDGLTVPKAAVEVNGCILIAESHGQIICVDRSTDGGRVEKWVTRPTNVEGEHLEMPILTRGLTAVDGRLYTAVFDFADGKNRHVIPRVVEFDTNSGVEIGSQVIPQVEQFRMPRVFALAPLPLNTGGRDNSGLRVVQSGNNIWAYPLRYESSVIQENLDCLGESVAQGISTSDVTSSRRVIISVKNVSISYQRNARLGFGFRSHLREARKFVALNDVSFDIVEGEVVGLIGRNGSGKSTMGMVLAGTIYPDRGAVHVHGKAQLLSLGLGFRNELTGRDNVNISATLLGLAKADVTQKMHEILEFAELEDFIDEPVRTYSAGMKSRLAFAVATAVEPDVLIIDEVLSTGDQSFRAKAEKRMEAMHEKAKTVVIVSHNAGQIRKLCTRVIWLERGQLMMDGKPKSVLSEYEKFCGDPGRWLERHECNKR